MGAERKERDRRKTIQTAVQGVGPCKEMFATCVLPKHEEGEHAIKLRMIPPTTGCHRMAKRQAYYEAVHKFMQQRRWMLVQRELANGGTSWLELLALFDMMGYRTPPPWIGLPGTALHSGERR